MTHFSRALRWFQTSKTTSFISSTQSRFFCSGADSHAQNGRQWKRTLKNFGITIAITGSIGAVARFSISQHDQNTANIGTINVSGKGNVCVNSNGDKISVPEVQLVQQMALKFKKLATSVGMKTPPSNEEGIKMVPRSTDGPTFLSKKLGQPVKTILVIGPTGSGKTTTINSMMNYLWDVEYDDNVRYKLISEKEKSGGQAVSQTDDVNQYYIEPPNCEYSYTIVDTPGYGDTNGIKKDMETTEKIKEFFETKIDSITGICFVVNGTESRLTEHQKYVFTQMKNVFGNDIEENIFFLLTFCDATMPPVLAALKETHLPTRGRCFKLNNSGFFTCNRSKENPDDLESMLAGYGNTSDFAKDFYTRGIKSFRLLFNKLHAVEEKSLRLTKQLLQERQTLTLLSHKLRKDIMFGLAKWKEQNQIKEKVEYHKDLIEKNKDFTFEQEITEIVTERRDPDKFITTCTKCLCNCHEDCAIQLHEDKWLCWAMDDQSSRNAKCRICPQKCSWHDHDNTPFKYVEKKVMKTITFEDLKKKYYNSKSQKERLEQIRNGIEKEIDIAKKNVQHNIEEARKCANKINQIGLNPNAVEASEYYDLLIQSALNDKREGYLQYVEQLRKLKEEHTFLGQVINDPNFDPLPEVESKSLTYQ